MERVSKLKVLAMGVLLLLVSEVEGGRKLKDEEPQSFLGGGTGTGGGTFPSPGGFAGFFCTFPGGCTPTLPVNPGVGVGAGSPPHA
ncbi:hypothetical protein K1719_024824 [Acacia pycnantha]|nr:hypothetical protein K1719_024824 [Acacia pycnantha]